MDCVGKFRVKWAEKMEAKGLTERSSKNVFKFAWVTNFPLFSKGNGGKLEATHHPFTAPSPRHAEKLFTRPSEVDIVKRIMYFTCYGFP